MLTNKGTLAVYIVKHHAAEAYICEPIQPLTTKERHKAFRFSTKSSAEKAKNKLKIPLVWDVLEVEYDLSKGRLL